MASTTNVLDLLEQDHEKIKALLKRLAGTTARSAKTREKLLHDIQRELEIHSALEEELVYPAVREAADDTDGEEMYFEFVEEHFLSGEVEVPRMFDVAPDTDEFTAKSSVLTELVTHHIEEEEERMFKRARKLLDKSTLEELGARVQQRKKELTRTLKAA